MATYVKTHKPSSTKHKPGETTKFELTPRRMGQPNMMQAHQVFSWAHLSQGEHM
jgi:hypothetical protein